MPKLGYMRHHPGEAPKHREVHEREILFVLARRSAPQATLAQIARISRRESIGSDPFIYARMRAHARSGILELAP